MEGNNYIIPLVSAFYMRRFDLTEKTSKLQYYKYQRSKVISWQFYVESRQSITFCSEHQSVVLSRLTATSKINKTDMIIIFIYAGIL